MKRIHDNLPSAPQGYSIFRLCMGLRKAATTSLPGAFQEKKLSLGDSDPSEEQIQHSDDSTIWTKNMKWANSFHFNKKNWYVNPPQVIPIPKDEINRNRISSDSTGFSSLTEEFVSNSESNTLENEAKTENYHSDENINAKDIGHTLKGNNEEDTHEADGHADADADADVDIGEIPHFSAAARAYNQARQGKERVVMQTKLESIFVNGEKEKHCKDNGSVFLVLTSEAYYLLAISYDSKQFDDGKYSFGFGSFSLQKHHNRRKTDFGQFGGEKETIGDDFSRYRRQSSGNITPRNGYSPKLIWRRPYRAVEKICAGEYGLAFYMSHRNSDIPNKNQIENFVAVCHGEGLALKLHNTFKQMCSEWLDFERSFVSDFSLLTSLQVVRTDVALQCAIKGALRKVNPEINQNEKEVFCAHVRIIKDNENVSCHSLRNDIVILSHEALVTLKPNYMYWKFCSEGETDQNRIQSMLTITNTHRIRRNRVEMLFPRLALPQGLDGYPLKFSCNNETDRFTYTMLFYDFDTLLRFKQFLKIL